MDRFGWDKPLEKLQSEYIIGNKDFYMSPGIYNKIKGKNKSSVFDTKKNDYHALGMTLLNMGVQDSVRNYYNEDGSVNAGNLQGHL